MELAKAIQNAKGDRLNAFAAFLDEQVAPSDSDMHEDAVKARVTALASAMSAWAYMQLHPQDQGD